MPELPEVETIVRWLRPLVEGRRFLAFRSRWPRKVFPSVPKVLAAITGRTIQALQRRGKNIVFALDDGSALIIHLGMSGRLERSVHSAAVPKHFRAEFVLTGGCRLRFTDARKFGKISHVSSFDSFSRRLGVEPMVPAFTAAVLAGLLSSRSRQIKPLLLDQSVLAGMGNIYTDEALYRAEIHPRTRSDTLTAGQVRRLHRAIRAILSTAIRMNGTSIDWIYPGGRMQDHLKVYGRADQACCRCGRKIVYLRVGSRGTHLCPCCQPYSPGGRKRIGGPQRKNRKR